MFTIQDFTKFLIKNGYSKNTINNYSRGVNKFLLAVGNIRSATVQDVERRKESLKLNARTINLYIHGVKKYIFFLQYMGIPLKIDPTKILTCREVRLEKDYIVKSEVGDFVSEVKQESHTELEILRNTLFIRMLWETGARVGELLNLKRGNFGEGYSIKVFGKGNKERIVFLSEETINLMFEYKIERMSCGMNSIWIFCSHSNNSKGGKLSRNTVEKIIKKLNHTGKHITPHSFRHGFATHILRQGGNIVDLQKALGHANLSTTSTYLHSDSERIHNLQKLAR